MRIVEGDDGVLWYTADEKPRTAEDSWFLRAVLSGAACGLAFGSGCAVLLSYLIDRLRR